MGKAGRAILRGKPLEPDCYRAGCSGVEFSRGGVDYYGCYGLMDQPDNYNGECLECGAFALTLDIGDWSDDVETR